MAELHLGNKNVHISRIVNHPRTSNCYVITREKECIIIDPGTEYPNDLISFLSKVHVSPSYILLTHEHYDHCWGVNHLLEIFPNIRLVASESCSRNIQDSRMNLSRYDDETGEGFTIRPVDIVIDNDKKLDLLGLTFHFLLTPGHSQGSMCFEFDGNFFSGDVIIPGTKPVLKLKGGSVADYYQSIEILKKMYVDSKLNLYPGHGEFYSNYSFSQIPYK